MYATYAEASSSARLPKIMIASWDYKITYCNRLCNVNKYYLQHNDS